MSFYTKEAGGVFAPGWFLADNENCTRITAQVGGTGYSGTVKTLADGRKIVPMGSILTNVGIVYEDVDVTDGAMPASIVVAGKVYSNRVASTPTISGITYIAADEPERPY